MSFKVMDRIFDDKRLFVTLLILWLVIAFRVNLLFFVKGTGHYLG